MRVSSLLDAYAKTDKISAEYLQNKKHFAILNPLAETAVEKIIKKTPLQMCAEESFFVLQQNDIQ